MKLTIEIDTISETISLTDGSRKESYPLKYPWGFRVEQFRFLLGQMGINTEVITK